MKRIEGEGEGGQSSQSVPFSEDHFKELKDRGLTKSTPSPSMRQTDYHQINASDVFHSKIGSLKVKRITGSVVHLGNDKGEHFMFSIAELRAIKAQRRSVSFTLGVNHGQVMISSEDDRDKELWRSMTEIFKKNGYTPASNDTMFTKLDTNIEDEEPKLKADIESEGYSTFIESDGGLGRTFHVYFDPHVVEGVSDEHIEDDIEKFDEILDTVKYLKNKDEKELKESD